MPAACISRPPPHLAQAPGVRVVQGHPARYGRAAVDGIHGEIRATALSERVQGKLKSLLGNAKA